MTYARATAMAGLLIALAGCQGPSSLPVASGHPAAQGIFTGRVPDGGACVGTGGVKVRPCPVTLTEQSPQVDVYISGPGVVTSAVKTNKKNLSGCGNVCGVGQDFPSDYLEWLVSAGSKCGKAKIDFYGYNQGGATVGIGHLKVINKDC
jgi:hypothetical protein